MRLTPILAAIVLATGLLISHSAKAWEPLQTKWGYILVQPLRQKGDVEMVNYDCLRGASTVTFILRGKPTTKPVVYTETEGSLQPREGTLGVVNGFTTITFQGESSKWILGALMAQSNKSSGLKVAVRLKEAQTIPAEGFSDLYREKIKTCPENLYVAKMDTANPAAQPVRPNEATAEVQRGQPEVRQGSADATTGGWMLQNGVLTARMEQEGAIDAFGVTCRPDGPVVFVFLNRSIPKPELIFAGPDDDRITGVFSKMDGFSNLAMTFTGSEAKRIVKDLTATPDGYKPSDGPYRLWIATETLSSRTEQGLPVAGMKKLFTDNLKSCKGTAAVSPALAPAQSKVVASNACIDWSKTITVSGTASKQKFEDANGKPQTAVILKLKRPVCFAKGTDEMEPPVGLQFLMQVTGDSAGRIPIGSKISITAKPLIAHTAHHQTQILLDDARINP